VHLLADKQEKLCTSMGRSIKTTTVYEVEKRAKFIMPLEQISIEQKISRYLAEKIPPKDQIMTKSGMTARYTGMLSGKLTSYL
jgi:hypothetical protein